MEVKRSEKIFFFLLNDVIGGNYLFCSLFLDQALYWLKRIKILAYYQPKKLRQPYL